MAAKTPVDTDRGDRVAKALLAWAKGPDGREFKPDEKHHLAVCVSNGGERLHVEYLEPNHA